MLFESWRRLWSRVYFSTLWAIPGLSVFSISVDLLLNRTRFPFFKTPRRLNEKKTHIRIQSQTREVSEGSACSMKSNRAPLESWRWKFPQRGGKYQRARVNWIYFVFQLRSPIPVHFSYGLYPLFTIKPLTALLHFLSIFGASLNILHKEGQKRNYSGRKLVSKNCTEQSWRCGRLIHRFI